MQQITVRLPDDLLDELEAEAENAGVSRSEHVRDVLGTRENTDDLRERLEAKEARIQELEQQLARRSEVEEKVDVLAKRVDDADGPAPPWPVRWWRWVRGRGGRDGDDHAGDGEDDPGGNNGATVPAQARE